MVCKVRRGVKGFLTHHFFSKPASSRRRLSPFRRCFTFAAALGWPTCVLAGIGTLDLINIHDVKPSVELYRYLRSPFYLPPDIGDDPGITPAKANIRNFVCGIIKVSQEWECKHPAQGCYSVKTKGWDDVISICGWIYSSWILLSKNSKNSVVTWMNLELESSTLLTTSPCKSSEHLNLHKSDVF